MCYAVAIGFGLVAGTLLLVQGHTLTGLFVLGLTAFITALIFSPDASARFLIGTIAALICSAGFAFFAAESEMTGKAVYYRSYGRVFVGDPVTRQDSPAQFRRATNYKWTLCILCAGVAFATFSCRRRLESSDF